MNLNVRPTSLAASALVIAALLLALTPTPQAQTSSTPDAAQLAADIQKGADHIDPVDLARKIIVEDHGYVLVDLRDPAEFADYHIPTAVNIPVDALLTTESLAQFANKMVVLYSGNQVHAGQAWLLLMQKGINAKVLKEGLQGWWYDVMTPASLKSDVKDPKAIAASEALRAHFSGNAGASVTSSTIAVPATGAIPASPAKIGPGPVKAGAKKPASGC